MEKLNLILLTKYGTSIKPWGNLHFALRLYVKRKVREVQSVPKRESNLAANGPWHQMKHLTNAAICLMFTLRHKIAPLQQNGEIIWQFTQWDCQAGGHQPGPYKDIKDLVLCVMYNSGLYWRTNATELSIKEDMMLIDINGIPHPLSLGQVRVMIAIGWICILLSWALLNNLRIALLCFS